MIEPVRRQPSTLAATIFVVAFCCAAAVLLFFTIPVAGAVLAAIGLAIGAVRMVRDIRGNRAM